MNLDILYSRVLSSLVAATGNAHDSDDAGMRYADSADILAWCDDLEARVGLDVDNMRAAALAYIRARDARHAYREGEAVVFYNKGEEQAAIRGGRTMKATLPAADTFNGKNLHGEKLFTMAFVIVDRKTGDEPVKAVVWHSQKKGSNYATVWAHGKLPGAFARHVAGHGRATGWGYHRPSAALAEAFESAGIHLDEAIDGRGDGAMKDACIAVAVALGYKAINLVCVGV